MKENDAINLLLSSGCSPDVIEHCKAVAEYARRIAIDIKKNAERNRTLIDLDINAVFIGGLLHDIGRSKTHSIDHAVMGAGMAMEKGLSDKLVHIIERHIGAGITREEAAQLGLPEKDYLPITIEEKIVAHADNLVFRTRIGALEELVSDMRKRQLDEKIIRRILELNTEICAMML